MAAELNTEKFEDFIAEYPIYEYRLLDTKELSVAERVRIVCKQECERYGTTCACLACGWYTQRVRCRIHSYDRAIFFSSVAEVSDLMNMEEMLATRDAHEELTTKVAEYLKGEGFCTFTLSTESCDICKECAYLKGEPCRHPERMHPCLESHGVVVSEIVEQKQMEYNLGGNTILWFSMVLFR